MGRKKILPPRYGDPFYRGQGRGCGRGRGRNWLSEETTERESGGGWRRDSFCGNGRGREMCQRTFENDQ